jgi:hypothetical protein
MSAAVPRPYGMSLALALDHNGPESNYDIGYVRRRDVHTYIHAYIDIEINSNKDAYVVCDL